MFDGINKVIFLKLYYRYEHSIVMVLIARGDVDSAATYSWRSVYEIKPLVYEDMPCT